MPDSETAIETPAPRREVYDFPTLSAKSKMAFESFDELDVKNLLNEDLERSRNTLILFSFLVILVCVLNLEIKDINTGVIKLTTSKEIGKIAFYFAFLINCVLAAYYIINAETDRIGKLAKSSKLRAEMNAFEAYLERFQADHDFRENHIDDEDNEIVKLGLKLHRDNDKDFHRFKTRYEFQKIMVWLIPWFLALGSIGFVGAAIWIRLSEIA